MVLRVIATFIACTTFSILFGAPKKELAFCGLSGSLGWLVYECAILNNITGILPMFAAALVATFFSRLFSFKRKNPVILYLISGIIPLVPGSGIYYTMYNIIMNNTELSVKYGIETLKIAGAISLGIAVTLALPYGMFNLKLSKKAKN